MDVTTIVRLLRFRLTTTAFQFKGTHYQQLDGVAMGSPVSPVIADIFMEDLRRRRFRHMKNRASGGDLWTMSLRLSQRRPEINSTTSEEPASTDQVYLGRGGGRMSSLHGCQL